jgi:hypothetical protein
MMMSASWKGTKATETMSYGDDDAEGNMWRPPECARA